jgi:anti-anti-sigma regulatory factor
MLRITTETTREGTGIKVEGRLAGPSADELERTWHEVLTGDFPKPTIVDLCGVTFIDTKGKCILRAMCNEGAAFRSCGPDITATVDEIQHLCEAMNKHPGGVPV